MSQNNPQISVPVWFTVCNNPKILRHYVIIIIKNLTYFQGITFIHLNTKLKKYSTIAFCSRYWTVDYNVSYIFNIYFISLVSTLKYTSRFNTAGHNEKAKVGTLFISNLLYTLFIC